LDQTHLKTTKSLKSWCAIGIATVALISFSGAWAAGSPAINGRWTLNDDDSETLAKQINKLKQEVRDFSYDHGTISDPDKPDPFDNRRSVGDKEWETRRNGGVVNPSVTVRHMVEAESLKYIFLGELLSPTTMGR
jgi:phage I-like protein